MSDNKKYYYIRLKESFFDSDEIKMLESIPNDGYKFSNILLKMYLKSLKYDGRLMFNDGIPFNAEMLSVVTGHSVGDVERAIELFKKFGLIEVFESGEIYMLDIQTMIGKSSTEADRIKAYRKKIEQKKLNGVQMYDKRTPEIEKEIEKETDIYTPLPPSGGDDVLSVNPAKEMLDIFNNSMNRTLTNSGIFGQLVMKNISVQEFQDVMNYIVDNWTEDIVAKFASSTLVKKFDQYSDKAREFGYRDGKRPKKLTRGKQEPKITTNADIQQQSQPKAQPPEDDPEDLMAMLKGRKTSG
ncbi:DNA replication protein DnaD (DnaD) [Fructobacillus tropaeoli]|uniref:phage replisome organizer N-terminal domain-containing protein n=1 Tax=Fructobacillus tropaeoli TaxID=709323 RepID=UPI002DAB8B36|nr:DNA replication protein DnaD (DnaD) [Fructobacillus tropaeoli]